MGEVIEITENEWDRRQRKRWESYWGTYIPFGQETVIRPKLSEQRWDGSQMSIMDALTRGIARCYRAEGIRHLRIVR